MTSLKYRESVLITKAEYTSRNIASFWYGLGSFVFVERRVTAELLTNHIYPLIKSILIAVASLTKLKKII